MRTDVTAAGALVWRIRGGKLQVLLVHRPSYDDWSWPKGKPTQGEHLTVCAVREVEEETGYRLGEIRKIFECFMSPGSVTEKLHFFVAEYDAAMRVGDGGGLESEGEEIVVLELPFDEAMAMIERGEIADAKTIILLQYAALNVFRA